jgi:transcriptional regulator with AAA-type ATPase domain
LKAERDHEALNVLEKLRRKCGIAGWGFDGVDSTNTTPEIASHEAGPLKTLGLLWVYPREAFVAFGSATVTIGRGADADAVLPSEHVSRVHARVKRAGPLFILSDAGSRNGTFRNGEAISEAPLDLGDVVRVGDWIAVVVELRRTDEALPLFAEPEPGLILGPRSLTEWQRLVQVAKSRIPILLEGPTGVGKEVYARSLHRQSLRRGSFVAVNCSALPEALAEAQLFGHARGAFTGALNVSPGLIAAADGGTLLLDELAELPASQQAKLLRVIEEGEVLRLGEVTPRAVDVRLVAACQRPLWELVQRGTFRADLLGRLSGTTVRLPALRERREEIPRLFLRAFVGGGGDASRLKANAVEALCLAPWPLNVRQLALFAENAATSLRAGKEIGRRAILDLLAEGGAELVAPLPAAESQTASPPDAESERALGRRRALWFARHRHQLEQLSAALASCNGNVTEAARQVGISRSAAVRLLDAQKELRLVPPSG